MVPEKFVQLSTLFEMAVRKLENSIIPYYEVKKFSFYQLAIERPYDIALRCLLEFVGHEVFLLSNGDEPIRMDPKIFKENRYRDDISQLYAPQNDEEDWCDHLKYKVPSVFVNDRLISWSVPPDQISRFTSCKGDCSDQRRLDFFRSELAKGTFSRPNIFIKQPDFKFDFGLYDYLTKRSSAEARRKYQTAFIEEHEDFFRGCQGSLICTSANHVDNQWTTFWAEALKDPDLKLQSPADFCQTYHDQKDSVVTKTRKQIVTQIYFELGYGELNRNGKSWDTIHNEILAKVDFSFSLRTLQDGIKELR